MRLRILNLLKWLLKHIELPDPRLERVRELVVWAESLNKDGKLFRGERKRHQVLNKLIVEFPDARVKDLSLLIEQVLQEL